MWSWELEGYFSSWRESYDIWPAWMRERERESQEEIGREKVYCCLIFLLESHHTTGGCCKIKARVLGGQARRVEVGVGLCIRSGVLGIYACIINAVSSKRLLSRAKDKERGMDHSQGVWEAFSL